MLRLLSARLVNLQSHVDNLLEFPETGIVRFLGGNSHGKSVLTKALGKVIKGRLHIGRERRPLVRAGCSEGYLVLTRNDLVELKVCIALEASQTYYQLTTPKTGEIFKRHITTDKGVGDLVRMFGFHYEDKRDISLNLYETFDPLVMVTTNGPTNYDLVTSVTTDVTAEKAKEAMEKQVEVFKAAQKKIKSDILVAETKLGTLRLINEDKKDAEVSELQYLVSNIRLLETPRVKMLYYVPNVEAIEFLSVTEVRKVIERYTEKIVIPNLESLLMLPSEPEDYSMEKEVIDLVEWETAFAKRTCVACGRGFEEGKGHTHA